MKNLRALGPAFFLFLLVTVASGTFFRSLMAGFDGGAAATLDWRRAHSHLGFYGVLFPAAWLCFSLARRWSPSGGWLRLYQLLVAVSFVGFLWAGYGVVATAASTGILLFWLYGAWRNRVAPGVRRGDPLDAVPLNTLLAAVCVPVIAVTSKQAPDLVFPAVRLFMTMLLLGVFTPSVLGGAESPRTRPAAWTLFSVLAAFQAAEFADLAILRVGAAGYGLLLAKTVWDSARSPKGLPPWLAAQWLVFAGGYVLQAAGVIPNAHAVVIAGLHFIVLGPILLTFFVARLRRPPRPALLIFYLAAVLAMVAAILLQQWFPEWMAWLQKIAAATGAAIVVALAVFSAQALREESRERRREQPGM